MGLSNVGQNLVYEESHQGILVEDVIRASLLASCPRGLRWMTSLKPCAVLSLGCLAAVDSAAADAL